MTTPENRRIPRKERKCPAGPAEERLEERIDNLEVDLHNSMHAADRRLERSAKRSVNGLRSHTRGRFAEQGEQIDELTAALDATRRAAASKEFPTAVAGLAFAAGALLAGAGWFFAPRGALRATLGEKKPSASQIESIKDAA